MTGTLAEAEMPGEGLFAGVGVLPSGISSLPDPNSRQSCTVGSAPEAAAFGGVAWGQWVLLSPKNQAQPGLGGHCRGIPLWHGGCDTWHHLPAGKPFVPKNPKREIPKEEQITLEPELEEALANATDAEMCDIAGEGYCVHEALSCACLHMCG